MASKTAVVLENDNSSSDEIVRIVQTGRNSDKPFQPELAMAKSLVDWLNQTDKMDNATAINIPTRTTLVVLTGEHLIDRMRKVPAAVRILFGGFMSRVD